MLVFWSLVRNSVVLAVYLLFSVACFFTVHEHYQLQEELERNQAEEGMVAKSVTETESSVVGVSVNIGTEVVFFTAISTMGMIVVSVLGSGIYIASQKPKDILSKMS